MLEQTGHDLEVRLPGDMQGIPPQPQAIPMRLEPAPPAWLAAHPPPPGMQLPAVDSLGQDDIGPGDVDDITIEDDTDGYLGQPDEFYDDCPDEPWEVSGEDAAVFPAPPSLDHSDRRPITSVGTSIASKNDVVFYKLVAHRCRSPFCPICRKRVAGELFNRWLPVISTFKQVKMLTFTIDPSLFPDSSTAYHYLKDRRCLSETLKELFRLSEREGWFHSKRYVAVLEFQKNGSPHFHVLVDGGYIPEEQVERVWGLHRPPAAPPPGSGSPPLGWTYVTAYSAFDAVKRAVAYVSKLSEGGYPQWVLDLGGRNGRFKPFTTSQGLLPPSRKLRRPGPPRKRRPAAPGRTLRERQADCGQNSFVVKVTQAIDPRTGELIEKQEWLAEIDLAFTEARDHGLPLNDQGQPLIYAMSLEEVVGQVGYQVGHPVKVVRVRGRRPARPADVIPIPPPTLPAA